MSDYVDKHNDLTSFNYQEYLDKNSFSNINKLEEYRFIADKKNLGDTFLYGLTDFYMNTHSVDMDNISKRVSIGEKFLEYYQKNPKKNVIYSYIGYYLLSDCSHVLEKEIATTYSSSWINFVRNFLKIKHLKKRFEKLNIFIKSKKHNAKKLIDNIRYGQFSYIWDRFYNKYLYTEKTTMKSKLTLQPFNRKDIIDNQIFYVLNNNTKIGEMIWLESSKYKMNYLSYGNIKDKYQKILALNKTNARVAMTGGFVNDYSNQEGLTVENGKIINASLFPNRDALVIIESNGKSHIINLKKGSFTLPNGEIISPLKYASDYTKLLSWSQTNKGSFFQTQLLAYDDKLLINTKPNKNGKHRSAKERRLLFVVNNLKNNKSFHIVLNIREGVNLAVITKKFFEIIREKGYHIEAILNLDVGSYNVMDVYDNNGTKILTSPRTIAQARNLLFYTQ